MNFKRAISLAMVLTIILLAASGCGAASERSDNQAGASENVLGLTVTEDAIEAEKENPGAEMKEDVFRGKIDSVSVSQDIIIARTADGKAAVVGGNSFSGHLDVSSWENIVAVSAGLNHILGLKSDGTVVSAGYSSQGQRNVSEWKDIVAIYAGLEISAGLKSDGTVITTWDSESYSYLGGWKDIVSITGYGDAVVGLSKNGDVYIGGASEPKYTGVKSICNNIGYALLINEDGTVTAAAWDNYDKYCTGVEQWTDIVDVATTFYYNGVGLRADGTVVTIGKSEINVNVPEWRDIVAIGAGAYHTVGLCADGTVVATGDNSFGQCEVSGWRDIVAIYADNLITVGLKADGTLVAAGELGAGSYGLSGIARISNVAIK